MKKVLAIIVVTLFTFNVLAINEQTNVNVHKICITENMEIVKVEPMTDNNFAILKKANLNEASLLNVAVSCSQCSINLQICLTMFPRPQCRQDFADCRELCT
ncbi:MAG: hypothetical protein JKX98_04775 [Alcanivoracaceae bacterium]|nr:hypothetical protein [Alcanivoracaceae bacterium]